MRQTPLTLTHPPSGGYQNYARNHQPAGTA